MANISFSVLQKPSGKQGILRPDGQGYYEQVIGGLNIENSAEMLYTAERTVLDLFDGSSTFKRKMERGVLRGENGHPKFLPGMTKAEFINRIYQIYEDRTCVHFKDIWLDNTLFKNARGQAVWTILAKFTPSGEQGAWLDKQLHNGCENVCFSIRSITNDYTVGGKIHRDIVEIITFDCVNEPGIHIAEKYKAPSLESFDDLSVSRPQMEKALDARQVLNLSQESTMLTRKELFESFGWQDTNAPRVITW